MEKKIYRVDLSARTVREGRLEGEHARLGGRGLTSKLILEETDPLCHPLSSENRLFIAPGMLAGTALSNSNRLSVGAKSPLTGGIKESNSGGVVAYKLGRLGIGAIVLEGRAEPGDLLGIRIDREGVRFEDLDELRGQRIYACADRLRERYGDKVGLMLVGPAGEMRLSAACISVTDPEGEPCRNIGRGGMGAVMGSKGVKALIVDDTGAPSPLKDKPGARKSIKRFAELLKQNEVTGHLFAEYGTARTLTIVNGLGGLPTRNFSEGVFERADRLGGEALNRTITDRGGMAAHACMPGCLIRCSNKYVDESGEPIVGSLDYETLCLLGSNIGIGDMDQVARLNRLCNEVGLDTIETGAALGVLAEGGLLRFGDFERAKQLLEEVGEGTPLGRMVGSGSAVCGKIFGVERVPEVKNQGMPAYDPRVIKGNGVTYAKSPMGADHTAGNAITAQTDHTDPSDKVEISRNLQVFTTVLDILGLCLFSGRAVNLDASVIEEFIQHYLGWKTSFDALREMARGVMKAEREFNRRAGLGDAHDRIPGFMKREPLPPVGTVFDVDQEQLDAFFAFAEG